MIAWSSAVSVLTVCLAGLYEARASLSETEREEIAEQSKAPPSMDLEVVFESRSSKIRIRSSAFIALEALGRALSSPDLGNDTFIVAGHSAVEGRNDEYSQELSEQRASSVKRFLIENFELAPDRIITVGYGSSKPKNVQDLYAQENQRVQIVNMGASAQK